MLNATATRHDAPHAGPPAAPGPRRGFSMVEVVFVVVVMAMIGAMAMPRYANFSTQRRLDNAERRLAADLALAQRHARQLSAGQTITFNVAQNTYQLVGMSHPDHPKQAYVVRLGDEPYNARIVSATFGGDASLVYNGYGDPDTSGAIVIAVGSHQKTINVDAVTGKVKKFNPGGEDPVEPDIEPIEPAGPGGGHLEVQ